MKRLAWLLVVMAVAAGVVWIAGVDDVRRAWWALVSPAPPHERYARELENAGLADTPLGRAWLASAGTSLVAPPAVTLPHTARPSFEATRPTAYAWRFHARRGRRIEVAIERLPGAPRLFLDLFSAEGDARTHVASAPDEEPRLQYEPEADGEFVLRLQPELRGGGRVTVRQRAVATLQFPVAGLGPRAVQSVFGDARDRGARAHEGVDIFAPRGTAVVAAAGGWVTRVASTRLGGKVVWVWDAGQGQAFYYAHLDRQEVSPGTRVKPGDLIGRVGNTGNAATTPPHLHFGVYRPAEGAIDPLPFICDAPCGSGGMAYAPAR